MLQIKNCVLTAPGVEIHIPQNCYLANGDEETVTDNGIAVYSADKSYRVVWQINEEHGNTENSLKTLLEEMEDSGVLVPVMPIVINGLAGHCVAYTDGRNGNYEAHFSLPGNRQLYFYIVAEPGVDIEKVMKTTEFREALNAVRRAE